MPEHVEGPTKLQVLRATNLLSSLTEDQIAELALHSRMAFVERGAVIWVNGSQTDFFGVVATGFVKMTHSISGGHEITTEVMGPAQVFGLLGVVDGSGCPQTAQAVCNTYYLKVNKRKFLEVYKENTVLKEQLLTRTTKRLRTGYDMAARMAVCKVEQRIAIVITMLAESYGTEHGGAITIEVPLTRQDVAEMAGTTVESSIRTFSKWQKAGLISTESKHITILKPEAMRVNLPTGSLKK